MKIFPALLAVCAAFILYPALAADTPTIKQIISGDEFILNDGPSVKLEGVKAPDQRTPELEKQSRDTLQTLTQNGTIMLAAGTLDRYGRISTQAYVLQKDGKKIWLQGEMLKAGMVFMYPPTGQENNLAEMQKAESQAHRAKHGMWNDPTYADVPADKASEHYGSFGLVSGKVLKAERVKNKFYLNFGGDWRTDFTVAIAAHDLKNFRKAETDPADYAGKNIRVRGWIIRDFGPMITVTNPAQIEIL